MAGSPAFATVTSTQITTALAKYCVPKPNDIAYGVSVCGSVFEGKYNANKTCECYDPYLGYSDSLRRCKLTCPENKIPKQQISNKCPFGYKKHKLSR